MNLKYFTLRFARHFMPEGLARFLLKHRWIISPGLESSDPTAAVEQYIAGCSAYGKSIEGKRILVFGYGGRFAVGVELLRRGAAHVVLCDHFVLLDKERNLELLPAYKKYLTLENNVVKPHVEFITLLHGDIRQTAIQKKIPPIDYVFSTSVYEHLDDIDGITHALSKMTNRYGAHIHFVDLRDHYFKLPFEMLSFSETVWKNLLNPTSNLNRLRLQDYRKIFQSYFEREDTVILQREADEFRKARARIRAEFISGDDAIDSATLIRIFAESPK